MSSIGVIAAVMWASSAAASTANAANKGGAIRAPTPGAVALTVQGQIKRNNSVQTYHTFRRPTKLKNDKTCSGLHRPHSCFPHQH